MILLYSLQSINDFNLVVYLWGVVTLSFPYIYTFQYIYNLVERSTKSNYVRMLWYISERTKGTLPQHKTHNFKHWISSLQLRSGTSVPFPYPQSNTSVRDIRHFCVCVSVCCLTRHQELFLQVELSTRHRLACATKLRGSRLRESARARRTIQCEVLCTRLITWYTHRDPITQHVTRMRRKETCKFFKKPGKLISSHRNVFPDTM